MSHRTRCHQGGFTLLEVIVSIALFALVMGIVYSGFTTAIRAYDAAERRVDEIERVRVVSAFIRRSVGGAHALAIAARREWTLQFDGAPQRLRYIADLPGYVGLGGVHEVVLELAPNGAQHALVMRRRPLAFSSIGEIEGEYETRVLAEHISGFAMRFYGRMADDEAPDWHEQWASAKHMPLLVELAIVPSDAPPWPLLQVRAQVDSIHYVNTPNTGTGVPKEGEVVAAPGALPNTQPNAAPAGRGQADPGDRRAVR